MDLDDSLPDVFPDDLCSIQEISDEPDVNDDEAHLLPTESIAISQRSSSGRRDQSQDAKLGFLQASEWDRKKSYDEDPPRHVRYTLQWKMTRNGKRFARDTLSNLVLAPSAHWAVATEPELQEILREQPRYEQMVPKDTDVVVSVTKRGQQSFQKRCKGIDIDWSVVEEQLLKWEEWFRAGKQLRVDLSLNFVDSRPDSGTPSKKGKRSSATQRQLAVQALQLGADGQNGQLPRWKELYEFMRCTEKFCNLGNYCWQDSVKQKHFPLGNLELMDLVELTQ